MQTVAQRAYSFILAALSENKTVYICTAYRAISVTNKTIERFKRSGKNLFEFNKSGDLTMRFGRRQDVICCKNTPLVSIKAQ